MANVIPTQNGIFGLPDETIKELTTHRPFDHYSVHGPPYAIFFIFGICILGGMYEIFIISSSFISICLPYFVYRKFLNRLRY